MFRPWRGVNPPLASLFQRLSRLKEQSRTVRWLLVALIVISVVALCYTILRLSPYLEGFEQYGAIGAFLISFISCTTVIFPLPGFAIVWAIAASPASNWAVVALAAGVGSGLGEFTSYLAGYGGAVAINPAHSKWYRRAEDWMRRYGSATIFIFSLTPLPFDVVGIAAGALRFPLWKFVVATVAGRLPRAFIGCYLAHLLIADSWHMLEWWGWVFVGVVVAVIIGGIIVWWRWRAGK